MKKDPSGQGVFADMPFFNAPVTMGSYYPEQGKHTRNERRIKDHTSRHFVGKQILEGEYERSDN